MSKYLNPKNYINFAATKALNLLSPLIKKWENKYIKNYANKPLNVRVAPYVKIISMNHNVNDYDKYTKAKAIKIGDNCWLGANAIILSEVELGEHTIVAAGAVVTKSFPEGNQVLGGNPAKIVKKLTEYRK